MMPTQDLHDTKTTAFGTVPNLSVDTHVRFEQLESACRIVAINRTSGVFIHARRDHHERRTGEVRVFSSRIWTSDESATPYCRSITTAFAR
jgi:hypothetical protein